MSRNLSEDHPDKRIAVLEFGTRQLFRRPAIRAKGRFVGIVYTSTENVFSGDDAGGWFLAIPEDLNDTTLVVAEAVVYAVSTGDIEIMVRNVTDTDDMLTTPITIDATEHASYTATVRSVPDDALTVSTADIIVVDVDVSDADALGLDIILAFG